MSNTIPEVASAEPRGLARLRAVGGRMFRSRAAGDFHHLFLRQFLIKCISFWTVSYAMRRLGPEGLGVAGYANAVSATALLATNLGYDTLLPKFIGEAGDKSDRRAVASRYYSLRLLLNLWLAPVFAVGCAWELWLRPPGSSGAEMLLLVLVWLAGFMSLLGLSLSPQPYCQGMDEIKKLGNAQVRSTVVSAALYLVVMSYTASAAGLLLIQVLGALLIAHQAMDIGPDRIDLAPRRQLLAMLRPHLRAAWPMMLNVLTIFFLFSSDSVWLAFVGDPRQVGLLASSTTLVNGVNVFIAVLPTVMYPRILEWHRHSERQMVRRSTLMAGVFLASVPLVYVAAYFSAKLGIPLLLGRSFTDAAPVFAALVCCFVAGVAMALATTSLILRERQRDVLLAMGVGSVLAVVLYPWAAFHGGAWAVAHCKLGVVTLTSLVIILLAVRTRRTDSRATAAQLVVS